MMCTSEVDNEFDVGKMLGEGKIPGIVTGLYFLIYLDDDKLSMDSQLKSAMAGQAITPANRIQNCYSLLRLAFS